MGADVYLRSINDRCKAEWEPKFHAAVRCRDKAKTEAAKKRHQDKVMEAYDRMYADGYFRDCYNGYGFFAQTELSWWRDVVPMLDDEGMLPIDKARELRNLVASMAINPASARKVAKEQKDKAPEGGWKRHYERDRAGLLAILDKSIELGEPLYCSL